MRARSEAGKKSPVREATAGAAPAVTAPRATRVIKRNRKELAKPLIAIATLQAVGADTLTPVP